MAKLTDLWSIIILSMHCSPPPWHWYHQYCYCSQCKGFENDFKIERQEKQKLETDFKKILNENQELQQRNRALQREQEKISRMIREEFERKQHKQQQVWLKLSWWINNGVDDDDSADDSIVIYNIIDDGDYDDQW